METETAKEKREARVLVESKTSEKGGGGEMAARGRREPSGRRRGERARRRDPAAGERKGRREKEGDGDGFWRRKRRALGLPGAVTAAAENTAAIVEETSRCFPRSRSEGDRLMKDHKSRAVIEKGRLRFHSDKKWTAIAILESR